MADEISITAYAQEKDDETHAALTAAIADEHDRADAAEQTLNQQIGVEAQSRIDADAKLTPQARTLAGLDLTTDRTADEINEALGVATSADVAAEVTRATAAEQANATAITAEATRAKAAENQLQQNIGFSDTGHTAAENTLDAAIKKRVPLPAAPITVGTVPIARADGTAPYGLPFMAGIPAAIGAPVGYIPISGSGPAYTPSALPPDTPVVHSAYDAPTGQWAFAYSGTGTANPDTAYLELLGITNGNLYTNSAVVVPNFTGDPTGTGSVIMANSSLAITSTWNSAGGNSTVPAANVAGLAPLQVKSDGSLILTPVNVPVVLQSQSVGALPVAQFGGMTLQSQAWGDGHTTPRWSRPYPQNATAVTNYNGLLCAGSNVNTLLTPGSMLQAQDPPLSYPSSPYGSTTEWQVSNTSQITCTSGGAYYIELYAANLGSSSGTLTIPQYVSKYNSKGYSFVPKVPAALGGTWTVPPGTGTTTTPFLLGKYTIVTDPGYIIPPIPFTFSSANTDAVLIWSIADAV